MLPRYFTLEEAAIIMREKNRSVEEYIRTGVIPAKRISNGSYIISEDNINSFIASNDNNRILTIDIAKNFLDNNVNVQTDNFSNLPIGAILSLNEILNLYHVDCNRGIKINLEYNIAVLIANLDHINSPVYLDVFCRTNNLLHYLGEGQRGDMDPNNPRNSFLRNSLANNSTIIVYQRLKSNHYSNCGVFTLDHENETIAIQPDNTNSPRQVLIYTFKPVV